MKQRYLLWFANEHLNFRLSEIKSILSMLKIEMKWRTENVNEPFWIVELPSDAAAQKIAHRSVCLRSILKLWGTGADLSDLHKEIKSYPLNLVKPHLSIDKSFRVDVTTFNRTFTMSEKVDMIEMFSYLPADGPVNLKSPDTILHYIEFYGLDPSSIPEVPFNRYFGLWLCDGQRERIHKLSLKTRTFIGNTSMDAQLSLVMANMAQVKPFDLVLDPFVGTGSLLIAAASYGAFVWGADIDFLMLHGRTRPTRRQARKKPRDKENVLANFKQYELVSQYLDVVVADSSLPLWHDRIQFDAIITDPPYGIREATERIGSTKQYTISAEHAPTHIPSKIDYNLQQLFCDLLHFAAKRLVMHGRLVAWLPVQIQLYDEDQIPKHPALELVANCEQQLSAHTSRRLLTWEKISEIVEGSSDVSGMFPSSFRPHYFCHGESRRERRQRKSADR